MGRARALAGLGRIVGAVLRGASDSALVEVCVSAARDAMGGPVSQALREAETAPARPAARTRPAARPVSVTVDGNEVCAELVDVMPSAAYRPK